MYGSRKSALTRKINCADRSSIQFVFLPNPCLILCPIMSFLTMAFAYDAFAAPNLRSPADLYNIVMPSSRHFVPIPIKEEMMEVPLFRGECGGPLSSAAIQEQLKRLGKVTGFREVLSTYCIQRGTANAMHGEAPVPGATTDRTFAGLTTE